MFQDALALHAFWRELEDWLVGSYLQKIWQTGSDDFLLAFYRPGCRPAPDNQDFKNLRLRVSLVASQPFVHPWLEDKPLAQVPSSFCMLVRKHCLGKPLLGLYRAGLERMIGLAFPEHILIIEQWDRRPNLLLVTRGKGPEEALAAGKILGGHKLGHFERKLLPGKPYSPPGECLLAGQDLADGGEAKRPDASLISASDLAQALPPNSGLSAREALLDGLSGFSPAGVEELLGPIGLKPLQPWDANALQAVTGRWENFWEGYWAGGWRPGITPKKRLTCWRGPGDQSQPSMFAGAAQLGRKQESESGPADNRDHWLKTGSVSIQRSLQAGLKKNQRKIEAVAGDLAKVSQSASLKEQADLLLAYQNQAVCKDGKVRLPSWDGSGEIEIEIERGLSLTEQAQRFYLQVKKYQRSVAHLEPRLASLRQLQIQLQDLKEDLLRVQTPAELEALRLRLAALLGGETSSAAPKKKTPSGDREPLRYRFGEMSLLVGRSPRQNDLLITRRAARGDLWFHVRDGGGAHVLLKGGGSAPPMEGIEVAALLAARHSSRKLDSKVEIVFLPVSQVKKPPGSAPGFVTYSNEMSITVDPADPLPTALLES